MRWWKELPEPAQFLLGMAALVVAFVLFAAFVWPVFTWAATEWAHKWDFHWGPH